MRKLFVLMMLLCLAISSMAQNKSKEDIRIRETIDTFLNTKIKGTLEETLLPTAVLISGNKETLIEIIDREQNVSIKCLDVTTLVSQTQIDSVNIIDLKATAKVTLTFKPDIAPLFKNGNFVIIISLTKEKNKWKIEKVELPNLITVKNEEIKCLSNELLTKAELIRQENELKKVLKDAKASLEEGKKSQTTYETSGQIKSLEFGYYENQIIDNVRMMRNNLLNSLTEEKYDGIKNHINNFYPIPDLTISHVGHDNFGYIVDIGSGKQAYDAAIKYINEIEAALDAAPLPIQININDGERGFATFTLYIVSIDKPKGGTPITITQGIKLFPGSYYKYKVTKVGYKPYEGNLDLLHDDKKTLNCTLRVESDSNESFCDRQ